MQFVLLALYTLFLLVWAVVDVAWQNLTTTILKSLVFVATIVPGFQNYLESKIESYPMPIAELPTFVRSLATGRFTGMALRRVDRIDFVEIDPEGRLRSLVKTTSPFNGLRPSEMTKVTGTMPILLLDGTSPAVDVETAGPVLMKAAFRGRVRSKSIVLLCDTGRLDAAAIGAPVLLADRDLAVDHVGPDSALLDFASALDGARVLLLKTLRGEPLVAPGHAAFAGLPPARGSLAWFVFKRMKCKFGWRGFRCGWQLDADEVQFVLNQKLSGPSSVASRSLGEEPFRVGVEAFNPRVALEGSRALVSIDLILTAPGGQGVVSQLLANPVALSNVKVSIDRVAYDPETGMIGFSEPRLVDVGSALPVDPSVRKILVSAINTRLAGMLAGQTRVDVRAQSRLAHRLLRGLEIEGSRLRVSVGLGRCEDALTRAAAEER